MKMVDVNIQNQIIQIGEKKYSIFDPISIITTKGKLVLGYLTHVGNEDLQISPECAKTIVISYRDIKATA